MSYRVGWCHDEIFRLGLAIAAKAEKRIKYTTAQLSDCLYQASSAAIGLFSQVYETFGISILEIQDGFWSATYLLNEKQ